VPEFSLERDSGTVVIGVNCVDWNSWIQNLPELIVRKAKEAGFGKVFPIQPAPKVSGREGIKEGIVENAEDSEETEVTRDLEDVAARVANWLEL
jgi:hypothetical protein